MTEGTNLRNDLALAADRLCRQNEDQERALKNGAVDVEWLVEQMEGVMATYDRDLQALNVKLNVDIANLLKRVHNGNTHRLMQAGIIEPPDDVRDTVRKLSPNVIMGSKRS